MDASQCSGAMTADHDGSDPQTVSIGIRQTRVMCAPCRDSAGRIGLIERRAIEPTTEAWCRLCDQPATTTVRDSGETVALCNVHFQLGPCDDCGRWVGHTELVEH